MRVLLMLHFDALLSCVYEAWITHVSLSHQPTDFSLPNPLQEFVLPQRRTIADNISLFLFLLHNKINSESKYLLVHNTRGYKFRKGDK